MLWQCSTEVMLDMWRVRFGTTRVSYSILFNERQRGDANDWPYVARLLVVAGLVRRGVSISEAGISYQLKE